MVRSISAGKNRVLQPDYLDVLKLDELEGYRLLIDPTVGMRPCFKHPYITINRDSGWTNATKLWPVEKYLQLLNRIQDEFPNIMVVATGVNIDERLQKEVD